jgi:hypothetical protein
MTRTLPRAPPERRQFAVDAGAEDDEGIGGEVFGAMGPEMAGEGDAFEVLQGSGQFGRVLFVGESDRLPFP